MIDKKNYVDACIELRDLVPREKEHRSLAKDFIDMGLPLFAEYDRTEAEKLYNRIWELVPIIAEYEKAQRNNDLTKNLSIEIRRDVARSFKQTTP